MRRLVVASILVVAGAVAAVAADDFPYGSTHSFAVYRNGQQIGTHTLAFQHSGDQRAVATSIDFSVKALGMTVYTELTGALVAQLAGRPPGGLSRREEEVAALVAAGLTNRQIAERLYISERTAQNHVQHILTKLGFTTRSQIAAWTVRRAP